MTTRSAGSTGRSPKTAILAIILVSYFMILLDNSIVFTGLPRIQDDLGMTTTGLSWVTDAYTLVFGGLLLLGARAGDVLGRRRIFLIGLLIFAVASLVVAVAPTAAWLLGARAVQGVGAAILAPTTLALLTATFREGTERTRAVAAYGSVAGIGASVGLVLGGVLADLLSWRVGFFINLPIGIVLAVAALRYVPETDRMPGRFDLVGALCSTVGVGALVFGIINSATAGWRDPVTVTAIVAGMAVLVGLVRNEARALQPIMPLRLFAGRERSGAYLTRMLYMGAMLGYFIVVTQFLQSVYGFSPLQAGLAFLPMTAVNFVVALAIPRLTRRIGNTALLVGGLAVAAVGMWWLSNVSADSSYVTAVAAPMVLLGIGQGLSLAPLTAAGIAGVKSPDAGAASGVVNTAHQLGGSLGVAVLTTVGASAAKNATAQADPLAAAASAALTASSVLLTSALLAVIFIIPRSTRNVPAPVADTEQPVAMPG